MAIDVGQRPASEGEPIPESEEPQPVLPATLIVVAAASAAAALAIVGVRQTGQGVQYSSIPEHGVWATLMIGLVGVSVAGGIYSWPTWRELHARSSQRERLVSYILSAFIVLFYDASPELVGRVYLQRSSPPIPYQVLREIGFILLIGFAALPAAGALVLAALQLSRRTERCDGAGGGVVIAALLRMRVQLQRLLAVLALVIGGNVLTIGAMRNAIMAYEVQQHEVQHLQAPNPIPDELLLVYGMLMTGLLALVYIPTYLAWQTRAAEQRDRLYPLPTDGRASHDWYIGRSDLEGLLSLKASVGGGVHHRIGLDRSIRGQPCQCSPTKKSGFLKAGSLESRTATKIGLITDFVGGKVLDTLAAHSNS